MRKEICISGFGGQGVGLAGYILGKALALYDGLEAVMTQSYGPEARGGASSANIVVSDNQIAYPFVQQPDVLVLLSQEAYEKFMDRAKPQSCILIDDELVSARSDGRIYGISATRLADQLGRRIVTNVVMLGFLTSVTDVVSHRAIMKALETTVKPKTLELNQAAFSLGFDFGRKRYARGPAQEAYR